MFFLDSKLVTVKLQGVLDRCCRAIPGYLLLEQELSHDSTWPPVSSASGGLADAFQRLQSVQESVQDDDQISQLSLDSNNDTPANQTTNGDISTADDIMLIPKKGELSVKDTNEAENYGYDSDEELPSHSKIVTKL